MITVLAPQELAEPLSLLAREYSTVAPSVTVSLVFGDAVQHSNAIISGEEAEMLISNHPTVTEQLSLAGMIDASTRTPLFEDSLVLVANPRYAARLPQKISKRVLIQLLQREPLVLFETERHPMGYYFHALLDGLHINPFLTLSVVGVGRVYPVETTEASYRTLSQSDALGILPAMDARTHKNLRVVAQIPEGMVPPVRYEAVVVAGESMRQSRAFLQYLKRPQSRAAFHRLGYVPLREVIP